MDQRALLVFLDAPYASYKPALAPAQDVILAALRWPTHSWADQAISWLNEGAPMDEEIAEALEALTEKKKYPQQLRHKAAEIARKWRHDSTLPNSRFDTDGQSRRST
jgi:hypothetical protein